MPQPLCLWSLAGSGASCYVLHRLASQPTSTSVIPPPPPSGRTGGVAGPDTRRNVLMMPMAHLSAPRQRKPLESHGSITTARFHYAARWRGGVAARGARAAAGDAGGRVH